MAEKTELQSPIPSVCSQEGCTGCTKLVILHFFFFTIAFATALHVALPEHLHISGLLLTLEHYRPIQNGHGQWYTYRRRVSFALHLSGMVLLTLLPVTLWGIVIHRFYYG
jgi:hypothetical protein